MYGSFSSKISLCSEKHPSENSVGSRDCSEGVKCTKVSILSAVWTKCACKIFFKSEPLSWGVQGTMLLFDSLMIAKCTFLISSKVDDKYVWSSLIRTLFKDTRAAVSQHSSTHCLQCTPNLHMFNKRVFCRKYRKIFFPRFRG